MREVYLQGLRELFHDSSRHPHHPIPRLDQSKHRNHHQLRIHLELSDTKMADFSRTEDRSDGDSPVEGRPSKGRSLFYESSSQILRLGQFQARLEKFAGKLLKLYTRYDSLEDETVISVTQLTGRLGQLGHWGSKLAEAKSILDEVAEEEEGLGTEMCETSKTMAEMVELFSRSIVMTLHKLRKTWEVVRCFEKVLDLLDLPLEVARLRFDLAEWILKVNKFSLPWQIQHQDLADRLADIFEADTDNPIINMSQLDIYIKESSLTLLASSGHPFERDNECHICKEDLPDLEQSSGSLLQGLSLPMTKPVRHDTCKFISCPDCIIKWLRKHWQVPPPCPFCKQPFDMDFVVALYERRTVQLSHEIRTVCEQTEGCRVAGLVDRNDEDTDEDTDMDMDTDTDEE